MKRLAVFGTVLAVVLAFTACDTFVSEVDQPVDEAGSEQFSDPAEAEYLITGVQSQWADTHTDVTDIADALSDELRFGINGDATFPTFAQLDAGIINTTNNSVQGALNELHEYRYLADDLLRRVEEDEEFDLSDPSASASEAEVRSVAQAHGANARYYLATYFGDPDNPRRGGGVIDTSEFIPSPVLHQRADDKYAQALAQAQAQGDDALVRQIQSARARNALYAGTHDYSDSGGLQGASALEAAAQYASQGFQEGEGWDVQYDLNTGNGYDGSAGFSRLQLAVQDGNVDQLATRSPNPRNSYKLDGSGEVVVRSHVETVASNPNEFVRLPLTLVNGSGTVYAGFGPSLASEFPSTLLRLPSSAFAGVLADWRPDGNANELPTLFGEDAPSVIEFGQGRYAEETDVSFIGWRELFLIRAELEVRNSQVSQDLSTGTQSARELVNTVRASYGTFEDASGNQVRYLPDLSSSEFGSSTQDQLETIAQERDRTLFVEGARLPDQRRFDDSIVPWHLKDEVDGQKTWQWFRLVQAETEPNPNF